MPSELAEHYIEQDAEEQENKRIARQIREDEENEAEIAEIMREEAGE